MVERYFREVEAACSSHVTPITPMPQATRLRRFARTAMKLRMLTGAVEKHPLRWLDPQKENLFDLNRFAGEGNIGHMVEQVSCYGMGLPDSGTL